MLFRSRRVGDFLKELHLTEGRNTGMRKMLNALRRNGSPDPVFETDEGRLYFLVTIYAHRSAEAEGGEDSLGSPTRPVEETGPGAERATAKKPQSQIVFGGVAQRQDELLDFFAQHPAATVAQAAKALGVGKSTINRDIESLKVEGRLRRHGSAKAGTWVVL